MGRAVIACYRPKEGKTEALLKEIEAHVPMLRRQGLATERAPYVLRAKQGEVLEVFEWVDAEAPGKAHDDPVVQAAWGRYAELCEFISLGELAESKGPFPEFEAL